MWFRLEFLSGGRAQFLRLPLRVESFIRFRQSFSFMCGSNIQRGSHTSCWFSFPLLHTPLFKFPPRLIACLPFVITTFPPILPPPTVAGARFAAVSRDQVVFPFSFTFRKCFTCFNRGNLFETEANKWIWVTFCPRQSYPFWQLLSKVTVEKSSISLTNAQPKIWRTFSSISSNDRLFFSSQRECISVHVGQAGCQIGNACWELYW